METVWKGWVTPNPLGQRLLGQGPSQNSILCPQRGARGSDKASQPHSSQAGTGMLSKPFARTQQG